MDPVTLGMAKADAKKNYAPVVDTLRLRSLTDLAGTDRSKANADARIAYEDSTSFVERWADLTAWSSSTAVQISAGRVYGNGNGANSGINHSWVVGTGEESRVVIDYNHVAGGTGGVLIGFTKDTAGGAFAAAGANLRGLYFAGTNISPYTDGVSGSALTTSLGTSAWTVTLVVDATYITITAKTSNGGGQEWSYKWTRSGFAINNIGIFNSASQLLTGSSVGPIGARKSFATVASRTGIEGVNPTVVWTSLNGAGIRIAAPASFDSRRPIPVVFMFHGNGSNELHWASNTNGKAVADAFTAAGYIVVAAANTANVSTWGAQAGLDAYYSAYQYLKARYPLGPIVFYGNSMGGIESLLSLAERRIPGVVAWIGTVPTANLAENYANALFTATIKTAYGIAADGSDYAAKTVDHDPMLKGGSAFRGVPMYALVATDDTSVTPSANWQSFAPLVTPYAKEVVTVNVTGGHSTTQIATKAPDMVAFADKYAK